MMPKLPGGYIAGLVDGEGHFGLIRYKEVKRTRGGKDYYWEGWRWSILFVINLHSDDEKILRQVRKTLSCGRIYRDKKRPLSMYQVFDFQSIVSKIIPFFEKYPLRAKKRLDFELWKEAVEILEGVKCRSGGRGQKMKILPSEQDRLEKIHHELKKLHGGTEPRP